MTAKKDTEPKKRWAINASKVDVKHPTLDDKKVFEVFGISYDDLPDGLRMTALRAARAYQSKSADISSAVRNLRNLSDKPEEFLL